MVHRCNRVVRDSRRESERLRDDLYQSQGETQLALRVAEGYKHLLDESREHFARCNRYCR